MKKRFRSYTASTIAVRTKLHTASGQVADGRVDGWMMDRVSLHHFLAELQAKKSEEVVLNQADVGADVTNYLVLGE